MPRSILVRLFSAATLALIAAPALAHPGHDAFAGFTGGLLHPVSGLDHVLAALAVGVWAGQQQGAARWHIPLAFVASLLAGALGAASGVLTLPRVDTLIALSVLVPGLMIACARHATRMGLLLVAGFALCHGYAHGLAIPEVTVPLRFVAGFTCATLVLLATGVLAARAGGIWTRASGAALAASGAALLWLAS